MEDKDMTLKIILFSFCHDLVILIDTRQGVFADLFFTQTRYNIQLILFSPIPIKTSVSILKYSIKTGSKSVIYFLMLLG